MSERTEVLVLGGGVIGMSIAVAIAEKGGVVALVERESHLGRGATGAAIGGITPVSDDFSRRELRLLSMWSTEHYGQWLDRLFSISNRHISYLDTGLLYLALEESEWRILSDKFASELDSINVVYELLTTDRIAELEPALTDNCYGAVRIPVEGALEPRQLVTALSECLDRQRITVHGNCKVSDVQKQADHVRVVTNRGVIEAEQVVVCLGMGTAQVIPSLRSLLTGVCGQAVELLVPGCQSNYALNHHIYAHLPYKDPPETSTYIVPRVDGRVAVGVTYEPKEDAPVNTVVGVRRVLDGAMRVVPSSGAWIFRNAWSGVRPGTVDRKPIIGFLDSQQKILIATGHFGLGVTLAPVTAQLVLELLGYEKWDLVSKFDTEAFAPTVTRSRNREGD